MDEEIAKALAVPASVIIREVYGDLAKPGVQQVGTALGTLFGLGNTILWPVAWLNEKAKIAREANLERYRRKMENTPEDEVCAVPPEVGVPILEKLSYVTNEELSEMYIELLAKASQKQSANVAHPSFVNIINNISPDEAILMRSIRFENVIPYIEVRALTSDNKKSWATLEPTMLSPTLLSVLTYPSNGAAYISNLSGLGILSINKDEYIVGKNIYESIEEFARKRHPVELYKQQNRKIELKRGLIKVTAFARLFLKACFSNKP